MTVIADSKKRVVLPVARPGDRFDVYFAEGKVVLTKLQPVRPKIRYIRKHGLLLAKSEKPISWEETRKAMDELL